MPAVIFCDNLVNVLWKLSITVESVCHDWKSEHKGLVVTQYQSTSTLTLLLQMISRLGGMSQGCINKLMCCWNVASVHPVIIIHCHDRDIVFVTNHGSDDKITKLLILIYWFSTNYLHWHWKPVASHSRTKYPPPPTSLIPLSVIVLSMTGNNQPKMCWRNGKVAMWCVKRADDMGGGCFWKGWG